MAIKKKATAAKSADAARKGAMTATVVKKVSPNVKIIKAGSKPLTQSLSEKRVIMEKAKGKTPAARAKAKLDAKNAKFAEKVFVRDLRRRVVSGTVNDALKAAGYDSTKRYAPDAQPATPAQVKAGNKARNAAEAKFKAERAAAAKRKAETKAADNPKRGQSNKGGKSTRTTGGGGLRGGFGMGGGGGSGRSNVNR
jgi:uncharacterized membrane protein YgcG